MAVIQRTPLFENVFDGAPARVEIDDMNGILVIAHYSVWTFCSGLLPRQKHTHGNDTYYNRRGFEHRDGQVFSYMRMDGETYDIGPVTPETNDVLASFIPALKALHAIAKQTDLPSYILENMPKAYAFFGLALPTE